MAKHKFTKFDDYIAWLCKKRGKSKVSVADETGHPRQYVWQIQHKPCVTLQGRYEFCKKAAEALSDSAGKLAFLAGINPWSARLSAEEQVAVWEFVERVVMLREKKELRPNVGMFNTLVRDLFGGLSVLDNEKMLEALHGQSESHEETVGNPASTTSG